MNFSSDRQLLKALSSVLHFIKTAARLLHSADTRAAQEHGPCHRAGGRAVVMPEPLSLPPRCLVARIKRINSQGFNLCVNGIGLRSFCSPLQRMQINCKVTVQFSARFQYHIALNYFVSLLQFFFFFRDRFSNKANRLFC